MWGPLASYISISRRLYAMPETSACPTDRSMMDTPAQRTNVVWSSAQASASADVWVAAPPSLPLPAPHLLTSFHSLSLSAEKERLSRCCAMHAFPQTVREGPSKGNHGAEHKCCEKHNGERYCKRHQSPQHKKRLHHRIKLRAADWVAVDRVMERNV